MSAWYLAPRLPNRLVWGWRRHHKTAYVRRRMKARAFLNDLYSLCKWHGASLAGSSQHAYEHWFDLSIDGWSVGEIEVDPRDGTKKYGW